MTTDMQPLIEAVEATVLKIEAGDLLFIKLPEEVLQEPPYVEQFMGGISTALEQVGLAGQVAVLVTTDAITLELVRFDRDDGGPYLD